jgi:hypothetical protein
MPTKEELKRATERAKAKAERDALRLSALAKSPQQLRESAAAMRATIPPELLSKRRAVGRSFDSPVKFTPTKPRESIFASPQRMKETEVQKYKRERHEAYAAWVQSKALLAEKMDRIWNQRHDYREEEEPDHEEAAAAEIGPFSFREPPPSSVPFLPVGSQRGRGRHSDEESSSDESSSDDEYCGGMLPRAGPGPGVGGPAGLNPAAPAFMPRRNVFLAHNGKPEGERPDVPQVRLPFPVIPFNATNNPYLPQSVASSLDFLGMGKQRYHTRDYEGRGRLGFMNDLPGSTRPW